MAIRERKRKAPAFGGSGAGALVCVGDWRGDRSSGISSARGRVNKPQCPSFKLRVIGMMRALKRDKPKK